MKLDINTRDMKLKGKCPGFVLYQLENSFKNNSSDRLTLVKWDDNK